jgi:hypothetical protein
MHEGLTVVVAFDKGSVRDPTAFSLLIPYRSNWPPPEPFREEDALQVQESFPRTERAQVGESARQSLLPYYYSRTATRPLQVLGSPLPARLRRSTRDGLESKANWVLGPTSAWCFRYSLRRPVPRAKTWICKIFRHTHLKVLSDDSSFRPF